MKTMLDRPFTSHIKNFDRVVMELSPYMTAQEIDIAINFMDTLSNTKFDINPSVTESISQLKIMLGGDRVDELIGIWKQKNQKLLTVFGTKKYKNKIDTTDKTLYDGLDDWDNIDDWEIVYD
jgi:hypothetical protein